MEIKTNELTTGQMLYFMEMEKQFIINQGLRGASEAQRKRGKEKEENSILRKGFQ